MRTVRRLPSKLEFAIGGRPAPTEDDHPGGAHPGGAHREGAHREGARGRPPGWQRLTMGHRGKITAEKSAGYSVADQTAGG